MVLAPLTSGSNICCCFVLIYIHTLVRYYGNMPSSDKVKTTILLDKTVKKLAQVHAIQNDMSLGKLIEEALKKVILP